MNTVFLHNSEVTLIHIFGLTQSWLDKSPKGLRVEMMKLRKSCPGLLSGSGLLSSGSF